MNLAPGMNAPVKVSVNEGFIQDRGGQYFLENKGTGVLSLQFEADSLSHVTVSYGDLYKEFFITSPHMLLELSSTAWLLKNKDGLNTRIDSINQAVNTSILNFTRSGGKSRNALEMVRLADSLRSIAAITEDSFLAAFYWYAAADLMFFSRRIAPETLRAVYFRDHQAMPVHPAWKFSFMNQFEGESLKRLQDDKFSEAVKTADWVKLRNGLMEDSSISDLKLADYVALLCSYELIFKREYGFTLVLPLLKNALLHTQDEFFRLEVQAIIDFHSPRIRGAEFPDVKFQQLSDLRESHLSEFKSVPLYLMLLPDAGESSQLLIREALELKRKFGKELNFLALFLNVPEGFSSEFSLRYPGIEAGLADWSDSGFNKILRNPDEAHFALIDKGLITWQFPAESPETGIFTAISSMLISNR
jgi:hypothetical protein